MFAEDLSVFFNDVSGVALAAVLNGVTAVKVILDREFVNSLGVVSTDPVAIGKSSDFPAATVGQTLLVDGTTFTIRTRRPLDDGKIIALELTDG